MHCWERRHSFALAQASALNPRPQALNLTAGAVEQKASARRIPLGGEAGNSAREGALQACWVDAELGCSVQDSVVSQP